MRAALTALAAILVLAVVVVFVGGAIAACTRGVPTRWDCTHPCLDFP